MLIVKGPGASQVQELCSVKGESCHSSTSVLSWQAWQAWWALWTYSWPHPRPTSQSPIFCPILVISSINWAGDEIPITLLWMASCLYKSTPEAYFVIVHWLNKYSCAHKGTKICYGTLRLSVLQQQSNYCPFSHLLTPFYSVHSEVQVIDKVSDLCLQACVWSRRGDVAHFGATSWVVPKVYG